MRKRSTATRHAISEEKKPPRLLTFLFGEAAETARRGASERLLRWAEAYEAWLAERKRTCKRGPGKDAATAWQRLLQQSGKMPWELTQGDIEAHVAWMKTEGYAPGTISGSLGKLAHFFRFCDEKKIDPECEAGFNPAEGVKRPKMELYRGATLLSREEVERLMEAIRRDPSVLGKRDYAFMLVRLRMGAPLVRLRGMAWVNPAVSRVNVRAVNKDHFVRLGNGKQVRLPEEVWEAIRAALEASGRWAGMREGDYVFLPLAEPWKGKGSRAEDWEAGKPIFELHPIEWTPS